MSVSCTQIKGSQTRAYFSENVGCRDLPVVHQVLTGAIAVGAVTTTLQLDAASTDPVYTAASKVTLYKDTFLYFGATKTPVKVAETVVLTTTAQTVRIVRQATAVAADAVAASYLFGTVCLTDKDTNTSTTTVDNTTDCTGEQSTSVNTAFEDKIMLGGIVNIGDRAFLELIRGVGRRLGTLFFAIDYGYYHTFGVVQITKPSEQGNKVKELVKFTVEGQVQNYITENDVVYRYQDAAGKLISTAERQLLGMPATVELV